MKNEIIQLAIQQLKEGGYENLNFSVIAKTLNTTRANIHHHFNNKEGLAQTALIYSTREYETLMSNNISKHSGDLIKVLTAIENHLIEIIKDSKIYNSCIFSQIIREVNTPQILKNIAIKLFRTEHEIIYKLVKKYKQQGKLNTSKSIEKLSFEIICIMHGIGQMLFIEEDKDKLIQDIKGSLVATLQ